MNANLIEKNCESYNSSNAVAEFSGRFLKKAERIIFPKFIKKSDRILDLGCGTGRTTSFLKEYDDNITGVDYAESMVVKAKELYPNINFIVADARRLPFENEQFNIVVFSFNGLDYIYPKNERMVALGEIRRVLKKDGLFIFSSHNSLRLPTSRKRLRDWLQNIFSLKWTYRYDNQEFGKLLTYFGSVITQKRDLKNNGFELIYSIGNRFKNVFLASFLESYIYYIAKKK